MAFATSTASLVSLIVLTIKTRPKTSHRGNKIRTLMTV
jgi:hypothetical protein